MMEWDLPSYNGWQHHVEETNAKEKPIRLHVER